MEKEITPQTLTRGLENVCADFKALVAGKNYVCAETGILDTAAYILQQMAEFQANNGDTVSPVAEDLSECLSKFTGIASHVETRNNKK